MERETPPGAATLRVLLKQHRLARRLTQEQLAERSGVSAPTISNIERGVEHAARPQTLEMLAVALGLTGTARGEFLASRRTSVLVDATGVDVPAPYTRPPTPLTKLIGREAELAEAVAHLLGDTVGMLTLAGPPGVGKTSLALALVAEVRDHYPDGCVWVPLVAARDAMAALKMVAQAFRLQMVAHDVRKLTQALTDRLAKKRLLLVLDNVERLLETGPWLAELVAQLPGLTLLVTSRTALHLSVEHVHTIMPLAEQDAVRLFLERARARRPELTQSEENERAISLICHRLDGLPLALELAASRLQVLSLRQLATRLDHALITLTNGPHDLAPHQQTLRDTLAWSYALLDAPAQTTLRWLAVFAGGFTVEAAEAVCGTMLGEPGESAFSLLNQLVDQHLVRQLESVQEETLSHGPTRFDMLATIHEFALEQLVANGDEVAARRAHAGYFLRFAQQTSAGLSGVEAAGWLTLLHFEQANLRVALRWAADNREVGQGLQMTLALIPTWERQGRLSEAHSWLTAFLDHDAQTLNPVPDMLRAEGLTARARLMLREGSYTAAEAAYREAEGCLGAAEGLVSTRLRSAILDGLGLIAKFNAQYAAAITSFGQSLRLRRASEDASEVAETLMHLGDTERLCGKPDAAERHYKEGFVFFHRAGDHQGEMAALASLGDLAMDAAEPERAESLLRKRLVIARQHGEPQEIALALSHLSMALQLLNNPCQSAALCRECVLLCQTHGMSAVLVVALECWGAALAEVGDSEACARAVGAASALRRADNLPGADRVSIPELLIRVEAAMPHEAYEDLWRSATLHPERAIAWLLASSEPSVPAADPHQR